MYAKGEYIHHATNGLCRVDGITTLDFEGIDKNKLYYKLWPIESDGLTVYISVDKSEDTTRNVMTDEDARNLIKNMPSIETLKVPEERAREQLYKEALRSMDYRDWVMVIKTIYMRTQKRQAKGMKATDKDKNYLQKAKSRLYGELALALDRSENDMESYFIEQIESQMK